MRKSNPSLRVQRRVFLSALGMGLGVAAASRLSNVALAQATPASKRFMLFYMPHGIPPEHFNPQVMQGDPTSFALDQSGVSILGPLQEQLKAYTTVVQGLKYPDVADTHEALNVALSGVGAGGTTLPDDSVARVTLEHQIANALGVKPLVLGAFPHREWGLDKDGKLMWDGTAVAPEKSPLVAYDDAFSGLGSGAPSAGPDPNVALTTALRSLTEAELEGLKSELSALTAEQTKLKTHIEAIQGLKAGGKGGGAISCTTAPMLSAVEEIRKLSPSEDYFIKQAENFPKVLAAQLQIAGAALACNARQVVAVQPMFANCDFDFGFMGSPGAHHGTLSHTGPQAEGAGLNITARQAFAKAQRWFIEQLYTHALTPLLEPDPADPSKKIIDNTIVYVMSEIGEGAWHPTATTAIQLGATPNAMSYLPSVIIGGGGGALKPGRVVTFGTDRPAGDLYLSLCQAMGVTGMFPDASGPITEVLA